MQLSIMRNPYISYQASKVNAPANIAAAQANVAAQMKLLALATRWRRGQIKAYARSREMSVRYKTDANPSYLISC